MSAKPIPDRIAIYDRYRKRLIFGVVKDNVAHLRDVTAEELEATLCEHERLIAVAELYAMTPVTARTVLNDYGLGFDKMLVERWNAGESLESLSDRHGPKAETISGWLKEAGAVIPSGNHRRAAKREELFRAYAETYSFGKAAKAVGVARNTAEKWLVETGHASAGKRKK